MQAKKKSLALLTATAAFWVGLVTNPVAAHPPKLTSFQPILIATGDWKEFYQEEFSISFPGNPSEEKEETEEENIAHTFTVESEEGYYFLSHWGMPKETEQIPNVLKQSLLEFTIEAVLLEQGANVLDKQSISLNGHPGIEFSFTYEKFFAGKGRMYLVEDKAYLLMSVTTDDSNSQKFFESFKLI